CSKDRQLHYGLKLHFGNSDVALDNPNDVAQVKKVFKAANGYHMPIVVHLHTSIDNQRKYGADEARVFLNELLAVALDVPVQIAHLAGAGGYDAAASPLAYPKAGWAAFQRLPLTDAEFRTIANNITPYMHDFAKQ